MEDPPPPPPPHGENPRPTPRSGGLPDGKYDIFIIPPTSAGSGFLYLPSLQTQRNSFLAGCVCTAAAFFVYQTAVPVVKEWFFTTINGGGSGVVMLICGVGVISWALGKTQGEGVPTAGSTSGSRTQDSSSHTRPRSAGSAYTEVPPQPPPQSAPPPPQPGPQQAPPPPPPPPPQPEPPPQASPPPPRSSWQRPQPSAKATADAKSSWEKAREETRKREEEKRRAEEIKRRREELEKERLRQREKEARERLERELKEKRDRELKELTAQREREERERKDREARQEREREQKERLDKLEKERLDRLEKLEKEKAERDAREKAELEAKVAKEREERLKAEAAAEKAKAALKKPPVPTARTEKDDDAYSFRPYDRPKKSNNTASSGSVYSEDSYAPSATTAKTTPPPSIRGPYSTKDPDKIIIKAVYSFNNAFIRTPIAQLVSGQGHVTDGLILRITTEGLFIDDDIRGVPQREWDIKAWTMKLAEVWCPDIPRDSSLRERTLPFVAAPRHPVPLPTQDQSCAFHIKYLRFCVGNRRMVSGGGESCELSGMHVLRASIRDQEGKRYVFIIGQSEGWKVAVGLQRLRKGSQVRALGVAGMPQNEAKALLDNLGWS